MDIKIEKSVQQKESQEIDPPHICTTFFFFWLFRAAPMAYGSSQARGGIRATAAGHTATATGCQIRAVSVIYTTAYGNTGSLTHWRGQGSNPQPHGY